MQAGYLLLFELEVIFVTSLSQRISNIPYTNNLLKRKTLNQRGNWLRVLSWFAYSRGITSPRRTCREWVMATVAPTPG